MTNMELALRLAEIEKAYAETPEGYVSLLAWALERDLALDLMKAGVRRDVAWNIAHGFC